MFDQLSSVTSAVKGYTVTRMILDLRLKADSVAQESSLFWGIAVVNSDARASGVLPDADVMNERAGWLVRGRLTTIQDSLSDRQQQDVAQLDLRSQRVMHNDEEELLLILDSVSAFISQWQVFVRVLMKLPL